MRPKQLFLLLSGSLLTTAKTITAVVSRLYAGVFRDIALKVGQALGYDLEVLAMTAGSMLLRATSVRAAHLVQTPGLWGLQWPGEYAQLGEPLGGSSRGTERLIITSGGILAQREQLGGADPALPRDR